MARRCRYYPFSPLNDTFHNGGFDMRLFFPVILCALVLTTAAIAQDDVEFKLGYAANLAAGDSTVNLTNSGLRNGFDPDGDICANVYVFAEDQQLIACCAC